MLIGPRVVGTGVVLRGGVDWVGVRDVNCL